MKRVLIAAAIALAQPALASGGQVKIPTPPPRVVVPDAPAPQPGSDRGGRIAVAVALATVALVIWHRESERQQASLVIAPRADGAVARLDIRF